MTSTIAARLACLACIVALAACGARSVPGAAAEKTPGGNNNNNNNNVVPDEVTETVTCLFIGVDLDDFPLCRSSAGSCRLEPHPDPDVMASSCTVTVSGDRGETLVWSSSCSDHQEETTLDGADETVHLPCLYGPGPEPMPPPPTPPPEPPSIEESVTCRFYGSTVLQECVSSQGQGCYGMKQCTVAVSGEPGTALSWKSSCGGLAETFLDGVDEEIGFKCNSAPPDVTEEVTCIFIGSGDPQECYSGDTNVQASCTGIGQCTADVFGPAGTKMTWKSSCGGYAYSVLDGNAEKVVFFCQ